jgi:putative transposase
VRCAFVSAQRAMYPTGELCRGVGIARSTYHAWRHRPPSRRSMEDAVIVKEIERIYQETGGAYGSPRMHEDLIELGYAIGKKRVERLMRTHRIRARRFRKRRASGTRKASVLAPNLLRRQFTIDRLNAVWISDITQVWTKEGWLYVAAVMDLCSRRIVGWSMSARPKSDLVVDSIRMALSERLPSEGLMHHSDQGSQYGSIAFQRILKRNGLRCSMSFRGTCADNAVAESFFSSLKRERTDGVNYETRDEARKDVFDYIEGFYNRRRRHSTLGMVSPAEFERRMEEP